MAEETKEPTKFSVGDLKKFIDERITEIVKSGSSPRKEEPKETETKQDGVASIQEQVQAALAGIRDKEAREARERSIDEQLASLTEKTKEKPPVEQRRVHKIMGWGD